MYQSGKHALRGAEAVALALNVAAAVAIVAVRGRV